MNLQKLFEAQQVLDEHIMNEHPELYENESNLDWKLLALQVELGECANEWRGFKKWSKNQNPITVKFIDKKCINCNGTGQEPGVNTPYPCNDCYGTGVKGTSSNPLLEEYVDCLHFILSIGIEIGSEEELDWDELEADELDITKQFQNVFTKVSDLSQSQFVVEYHWRELFEEFYWLGILLSFTWNQIEDAYFEKNKINHQRQENGY